MSGEDKEFEMLKEKRLAEMQKNLSMQNQSDENSNDERSDPKMSPRDYVVKSLG